MTQQVQELIDKIKAEGIQSAQQKAKEIETAAGKKAEAIIQEAKVKAEQLIAEAEAEIKRKQDSTHMSLKQSSRDMLLALRNEIDKTLQNIISREVSDTLTPASLAKILGDVIKNYLRTDSAKGDIQVYLNAKDLNKLKKGFMAKLQKQVKKPIKLQAQEDIDQGFMISFDSGKSRFDFTDESLVEFLSSYLNQEVASLLKEAAKK